MRSAGNFANSFIAAHRKVEALFAEFEKAEERQKAGLTRQICAELTIHTMLEEQLFYRACRQAVGQDEEAVEGLDEAQVEHDAAKLLIANLWSGGDGDEFRDAKVTVLAEQVRHHVAEEEKPKEGVFAKAKAGNVDTPELAQRLTQFKAELQAGLQAGRLGPGRPLSINLQTRPQGRNLQEESMPRYEERDERGRFTDDDDRRGGRSYASSGGRGGRQYDDDRDRDRDRGQGGWFGDPEGHSRASREGWDDRRSSSGRGRDDDDRDYRSRGRGRDDDDDRGGRGRGQGGWFGDSEAHSRAAREGWDNPDHGRSGWFGDSEGHSRAAREGWDNPDHGRSGWYGDSRGHSEASRRGWDERRDDDRGSRSRGRDDEDDRRYRSRSRDDDDDDRGRGRGHGGWFGDSEGHSRAAREGRDDRR